jgi:hypothetical protein
MGKNIIKTKQIVFSQIIVIKSIILLLINFSQSECKMIQQPKVINPVLYSDYQSSSYLPGHPRSLTKVAWIYKTKNDDEPVHLSLVGNLLIAGNQKTVTGLELSNGNLAWNEWIRKGFNHTCTEDGVMVDKSTLLKFDTKEKTELPISAGDTRYVLIFQKVGSRIVFACRNIYEPVERGEAPWVPHVRIVRYEISDYKETYAQILPVELRFSAEINSVLLTKDDKQMVLLSKEKSYAIHPLEDMEKEIPISVSHTNIQCGSLSESGNLLLVEKRDKGNYLKCSSLDGKQKWETELPEGALCDQPPACTPKGNILYMAGDKLVSINNGTIQWSTGIDYIPEHSFLTAFGNNSAIVVTGTQLVIIDDVGKVKTEMQLPSNATCRPIIGTDGAVYVGGTEGVCCIK